MFIDRYSRSSKIIFKIIRFNKLYSSSGKLDEKCYASRSNYIKRFGHLNYISRNNACFDFYIDPQIINNLSLLKQSNNINTYLEKINKISQNINKNSGIYDKYGEIKKENLIYLKDRIKSLDDEQIIWESFIWFNNEIVENSKLYSYKNINRIIKNNIEKLFSKYRLSEKDIYWYYAIHINTNGFHIHIDFFEEKKTIFRNNENGNLHFINKGKFPIYNIDKFKQGIIQDCILIENENKFLYNKEYNFDSIYKKHFIKNKNINNIENWYSARQVIIDLKYGKNDFLFNSIKFSNILCEKINPTNINELRDIDNDIFTFKERKIFNNLFWIWLNENNILTDNKNNILDLKKIKNKFIRLYVSEQANYMRSKNIWFLTNKIFSNKQAINSKKFNIKLTRLTNWVNEKIIKSNDANHELNDISFYEEKQIEEEINSIEDYMVM